MGYLYILFFVYVCFCFPPIHEFQGFAADVNFQLGNQVVVETQSDINTLLMTDISSTCIKIWSKYTKNPSIRLSKNIVISNKRNICIEGPVTFLDHGIYIQNNSTNIILYNIRIINSSIYGVLVKQSSNVIIDHVTILNASRGSVDQGKCIDITEDTHNVTVSHSILGYMSPEYLVKYKGMLIANFLYPPVNNISVHHNIFFQNYQRSPQISTNGLFDFRNNLIFNYTEYGSRFREGSYGNVIGNYYIGGHKDPLVIVRDSESIDSIKSISNCWKKGFISWQDIPEGGAHFFEVPKIETHSYAVLLDLMKGWGSLQHGKQEQTVIDVIENHSR